MSGNFDQFSRDYHYLSSIPLAPTGSTPRNLTHYAIQPKTQYDSSSPSTSGRQSPVVPSPYENPNGALFPFTPGPLEVSAPHPLPPLPSPSVTSESGDPMSSPPRPRRPSKPDLALLFGNPLPPPSGPLPDLPEEGDITRSVSPRSPALSYRKPVPSFLPTPPRADPLPTDFVDHSDQRSSSPTSLQGQGASRLSVGTFEGLLQQGDSGGETPASAVVAGYRDEGQLPSNRLSMLRAGDEYGGDVIWSPRLNLGLNERGVEAREERVRQDQLRLQREMEGQDLGDPSYLLRAQNHAQVGPHTPSPRRGKRRGEKEFGAVGKRDIPFLSPRYTRGTANEEEDPEEVDQSGPVLRRGSKRLSDLAEPSPVEAPLPDLKEPSPPPTVRRKSKASTLQKLSKKQPVREREKSKKRGREGNEVEVVVHDSASQDEGDYSEKSATPVIPGDDEGDWERTRREATCLAGRMNWSLIEFDNWFARFIHLLYPFVIFAHIPATIFLDYNLLYLLVQVALYPAFPSANSVSGIFARAIVPVPAVAPSTGWWIAVGVYAACTAIWLFGVCIWRECGRGYLRRWGGGGGRVQIEKVYVDAASFNYACARSYGTFSFMWQVRLAPLRPKSPLGKAVEGTSRLDFIRETFCWYRQNWPTVLLLIPRAAISVAVLLLYSTTLYGSSTNIAEFANRDSAYFNSTTGALTGFAAGVVLANCCWAALRLVVLVFAWIGLWIIDRPFSCLRRSKRDEAYSSRYQIPQNRSVQTPSPFGIDDKSLQFPGNDLPRLSYGALPAIGWRARRQRRLRAGILVCLGSTPLSSTASTFPSPYLHSPYVLGAGSPWSQSTGKGKSWFAKANQDDLEDRKRANLSMRGAEPMSNSQQSPEVMMSSPGRRQGLWGKVSPFIAPTTFHRSPIISFSRASPPPPLGAASGLDPHHQRGMSAQQGDGTDLGDSRLHRRVRSVPIEHDDYIHFDEVPLSTHTRPAPSPPDLPRRYSTTASFPSPVSSQAPANQYPFPTPNTHASPLKLSLPRPNLVSRFSAFSSAAATPSSAPSHPIHDYHPTPSSSGLLEAQLAHIPSEHLKLSDKLLSELRRVESYDRKQHLDVRRGSEIETASFATAREAPASSAGGHEKEVDPTFRYSVASYTSQPDSVGGQSESSTLRGAVRTPDLSRSLATFANTNHHDEVTDTDQPTTASPERPLLPPFRLSSDSRADNLSLGPATPVLDGDAHENGEFAGVPMIGHEKRS